MSLPQDAPELTLVIPVYNEQDAISGVIQSWVTELFRLQIRFVIRVYNDGSRDGTKAVLDALGAQFPMLTVTHKENSGHGPTILQGYREAASPWVFQMDSDDEMGSEGFAELWANRGQYDLLMGVRNNRQSPFVRRLITGISRVTIGLFFGRGIRDVNSPYRLMRGDCLREVLPLIPGDTFAPNLAIVGLAARKKWRIFQTPVEHRGRRTGTASIVKWRLWRAAFKSFVQTVRIAFS